MKIVMKDKYVYIGAVIIFLFAIFTRFIFLGYSTLIHTEAENALNAGYVLDCYKGLPPFEGLCRLWHIFLNNNNPLMQGIIFNTPLAAYLGLGPLSIRLNAAIGGIISLIIMYILVRRHADNLTALFTLALLTFNPFLITFNRFGHSDSLQVAFILGGVLLLDIFTLSSKPKIIFIILSSLLFSLAFVLKYNAIFIIILILFLYRFIFNLKFRSVALIFVLVSTFSFFMFFDQLDKFMDSMRISLWYARIELQSDLVNMIINKFKGISYDVWIFLRGHAFYFELIALPLLASMAFWKNIKNRLFKFMLVFSVLYFGYLFLQGRPFYRYFQIGIITASTALAFPLRRLADKKYFYGGTLFLSLFVLWSVLSHCSYIFSQYHHIPYEDIVRISKAMINKDNSIILYGRNPETEFYFSPDGTLIYDARKNPSIDDVILIDKYPTWRNDIKKIHATLDNLLDPEIVHSGDIVIVSGTQMDGGEPNPKSLEMEVGGIHLWGIRKYGHRLENVAAFYDEHNNNTALQKKYAVLKKIFLTNDSDELAALILRKR